MCSGNALKCSPRRFMSAADHDWKVTVANGTCYSISKSTLSTFQSGIGTNYVAGIIYRVRAMMPRHIRQRLAQRPRPVLSADAAAVAADAFVAGEPDQHDARLRARAVRLHA